MSQFQTKLTSDHPRMIQEINVYCDGSTVNSTTFQQKKVRCDTVNTKHHNPTPTNTTYWNYNKE